MGNPNCCFMIIAVVVFSPANRRGELCYRMCGIDPYSMYLHLPKHQAKWVQLNGKTLQVLKKSLHTTVFIFQGFNPLFEYRDLSAWRVNISKVATHRDVNGKNSFFFVIEVQRCGSSDQTPNPESTNSDFFFLRNQHTMFEKSNYCLPAQNGI